MSATKVRAGLETALAAMSPAITTAYENKVFAGVPGTAYQRVNVLFAEPLNEEMTASYTERGIMQVTLCYPADTGPGAAVARAELIRTTFKRGASFTASGVTTRIVRTPEIRPAFNDADRFCVPVTIRFEASVQV